jgi:hypothetical protein
MSTMRENQLKIIKYNHLIANLLIFYNCRTITLALKELGTKGVRLTPDFYSFTNESLRLPKIGGIVTRGRCGGRRSWLFWRPVVLSLIVDIPGVAKQVGCRVVCRALAVYWPAMLPDCELSGRAAGGGMSRNSERSAGRSSPSDSVSVKDQLVSVEALGKCLFQPVFVYSFSMRRSFAQRPCHCSAS